MSTPLAVSDSSIDTSELLAYAKRMAEADANLNREFGKALRKAAESVVPVAKALAPVLGGSKGFVKSGRGKKATFAYGSTQIAPTIKVAGGSTRIVIKAGIKGKSSPPAAAFEGPKPFRHPLFGNRDHWYYQAPHPYLAPALLAKRDTIRSESTAAVFNVLRTAGYSTSLHTAG